MSKQSKITKSARDEECQVRIPGVCNFDNSTTIFAHLNGGGMGAKVNDIHGSYCCSSCHDAVDNRVKTQYPPEKIRTWLLDGTIRTQVLLLDKGLIKIWA